MIKDFPGINDMKIAIDLETTGFNRYKNDVISIGAVEITQDMEIRRTFECFLRPGNPASWTSGAEVIHKITKKEALAFPHRRTGLINLLKFLKPLEKEFPLDFIYHGSGNFDFEFLKNCFMHESLHDSFHKVFTKDRVISTLTMARDKLSLENNKLPTVCNRLGIDLDHHNALSDAIGCAQIYRKLATAQEQIELNIPNRITNGTI